MAAKEESLVINRPRRCVSEFIVSPEYMFFWISNIIEYQRITEGPLSKDLPTRAKLKVAGRTAEIIVETFEFEAARQWTSRTLESFIDVEVGTRLEDGNGGTRATFRQESACSQEVSSASWSSWWSFGSFGGTCESASRNSRSCWKRTRKPPLCAKS